MKFFFKVIWLLSALNLFAFENIVPDSPLYDDIYFLLNRGLISGVDIAQKPLNRLDVAKAIQNLDSSRMDTHESWALNRLQDELIDELKFLNDDSEFIFTPNVDLDFKYRLDDGDLSASYLRTHAHIKGYFSLFGKLNFVSDFNANQNSGDDPLYWGNTDTSWGFYTNESYLEYNSQYIDMKFGRDYYTWGPARNNNLILSANSPPLDILTFGMDYKIVHFSSFFSTLSDYADSVRYLAGSRLQVNLLDEKIMLAANQVNIWRAQEQTFDFNFTNPMSFKYWLRTNGEGESNILYSFDAYWITPLKNRLFLELLIDDVQYLKNKPSDLEPNELGITIGLENSIIPYIPGLEINLDYTAITNRTYNTNKDAQKYIHKNKSMGHGLGNDFDIFNVTLSRWHLPWLKNVFTFSSERNGEGDILKSFDMPWTEYTIEEGYSEPFPTGIIEKTLSFSLETLARINTYVTIKNITGLSRVQNENNVASAPVWNWSTEFLLSCRLAYGFQG